MSIHLILHTLYIIYVIHNCARITSKNSGIKAKIRDEHAHTNTHISKYLIFTLLRKKLYFNKIYIDTLLRYLIEIIFVIAIDSKKISYEHSLLYNSNMTSCFNVDRYCALISASFLCVQITQFLFTIDKHSDSQ